MAKPIPSQPSSNAAANADLDIAELSVIGLECWRGERRLFRDLSFQLRRTEIMQIRGDNGAGKTTLLRTLCGLCLAEHGQIIWRGTPVSENRSAFLSQLHYIGHLDGVKLDLTASENVDFSRAMQISPSDESTSEILGRVGLSGVGNAIVRTLSAGQKRRVALSRLLTTRAAFWVLDEPFTSLDRDGEAIVRELLLEHLRRDGLVVFSSHQTVALGETPIVEFELSQ